MSDRGIYKLIKWLSSPLVEGLLALLCLMLIAQPSYAMSEHGDERLPRASFEFDDSPAWYEPAIYSLRVMSLGIAGLVGLDLHDEDPSYDNFKRAFSSPAPRLDNDGVLFNLVLHPLWGSETYLRARSNGMTMADSFVFSMSASVVWEYLIESWTEHPSRQDLLFTTGIGWMLGEGRYQLLQNLEPDQKVWADPLYKLLEHVDMNARISPDGKYTPMLGIAWDF